uniref:Uncharacterized protein n=1 Tax=Aegilops tauschii subsp. strangulata TaxID=200361 RepID=A0A453QYW9_AEGTS
MSQIQHLASTTTARAPHTGEQSSQSWQNPRTQTTKTGHNRPDPTEADPTSRQLHRRASHGDELAQADQGAATPPRPAGEGPRRRKAAKSPESSRRRTPRSRRTKLPPPRAPSAAASAPRPGPTTAPPKQPQLPSSPRPRPPPRGPRSAAAPHASAGGPPPLRGTGPAATAARADGSGGRGEADGQPTAEGFGAPGSPRRDDARELRRG